MDTEMLVSLEDPYYPYFQITSFKIRKIPKLFIDRAGLSEKSVRQDKKTIFWPPSIIARLVTKPKGNKTVPI